MFKSSDKIFDSKGLFNIKIMLDNFLFQKVVPHHPVFSNNLIRILAEVLFWGNSTQ
jgi:hypothetical protein